MDRRDRRTWQPGDLAADPLADFGIRFILQRDAKLVLDFVAHVARGRFGKGDDQDMLEIQFAGDHTLDDPIR